MPAEAESLDKINSEKPEKTSSHLPGRPVTTHYSSLSQKLHFMDTHKIDISVISLANPWLDFLPAAAAHTLAGELNRDLEDYCAAGPAHAAAPGLQRLYGFGLLPLVPGAAPDALVAAVEQADASGYRLTLRRADGELVEL